MTLKANELRIGNYLNGKQGHVTVTEIRKNNIVKIQDNTSSFYVGTCLQPIPLTDEMLINLGAFKFDNQFIFDRFRLKYRPDYKFYYVTCRETNAYITKVEFVHEWQNVVFALNSQELTLKNNSNN